LDIWCLNHTFFLRWIWVPPHSRRRKYHCCREGDGRRRRRSPCACYYVHQSFLVHVRTIFFYKIMLFALLLSLILFCPKLFSTPISATV
jgi:hypothetical protein